MLNAELTEPRAVQRLINVLAAVEFLHGHDRAMSLAERLALNEPESSEPKQEAQKPEPAEPEPPMEAEPELPREPMKTAIRYFDVPRKARWREVRVGSVLRRRATGEDFKVTDQAGWFIGLDRDYLASDGTRKDNANLCRSGGWLLVGEVIPS